MIVTAKGPTTTRRRLVRDPANAAPPQPLDQPIPTSTRGHDRNGESREVHPRRQRNARSSSGGDWPAPPGGQPTARVE